MSDRRTFKTFLLTASAHPERNEWVVEAYTSSDRNRPALEVLVANATFAGLYDDDLDLAGLKGWNVEVHPEFRRRGLASAMYEFAEDAFGVPIQPGGFQTPMGAAFLKGRKMPLRVLVEHLEQEFGVSLDASLHQGVLTVSRLVVPEGRRERGTGTRVMQEIIDYADEHGYTVALSPSSDFGGSKKRLEQFYRRLGFIPNKGRNRDFAISETMFRPPEED